MAAVNVSGLHPVVRERMNLALDYFQWLTGIRPTVTSGYRTPAQQATLYVNRAANPYPVNRPGDSAHQFGLAFDSSFSAAHKAQLMPLWKEVRWAVGFHVPDNDDVHAEVPGWRSLIG